MALPDVLVLACPLARSTLRNGYVIPCEPPDLFCAPPDHRGRHAVLSVTLPLPSDALIALGRMRCVCGQALEAWSADSSNRSTERPWAEPAAPENPPRWRRFDARAVFDGSEGAAMRTLAFRFPEPVDVSQLRLTIAKAGGQSPDFEVVSVTRGAMQLDSFGPFPRPVADFDPGWTGVKVLGPVAFKVGDELTIAVRRLNGEGAAEIAGECYG